MSALLLVKVTAPLALALGVMPLLRRRSPALRHAVLMLSLAAATLMPFLTLVVPGWGPSPVASLAWTRVADVSDAALPTMWAAGAVVQALVLAAGLLRLWRVSSLADTCDDAALTELALDIVARYHLPRPVRLLHTECALAPMTWGHWRPEILLPRDASTWNEERAVAVLRHELAHVGRSDWLMQLFAAFIRSVYWWHPLVWVVARRLRRESEYACDARVVSDGLSPHGYASHLLDLARASLRSRPALPVASMASRSMLESRVRHLLDRRCSGNGRAGVGACGVAATFAIAVTVAVAGYGSRSRLFAGPVVIPLIPEKPITLTLLLDGRMVDLSKYVPPPPDPNAGVVEGAVSPEAAIPRATRRTERIF